MRVLIDYRPALRSPSGSGEYTRQLAIGLVHASSRREPLTLTLFSSSWKDRLVAPPELSGLEAVDLRIPVSVLNFAWHRLGWPPAEWLVGRHFDVAHSSHPLLMPARQAAQVVTIHDLNFLKYPEMTRGEIRRDYPTLVKPHAARADRVIVPSRFAAAEVERELGVPPDRVSVCVPGAPDWAPRSTLPPAGYILFIGTLEPRKNIGTLLDAYEQLVSTWNLPSTLPELVLAGTARPEAQGWLDRMARPPLKDHVRHLGYVDPSARVQLYEGARLLVLPSLEEGFGLPVLEAMTIGVPVVAANRGALPEVLGDAGILVDPEEAPGIAAAIHRMITDDMLAGACAAKGVLRARQFSWTTTAEHVVEAYRLAIERRAARERDA